MKNESIVIQFADIGMDEQEKYAGKHIAVIDGQVAGWGNNATEALKAAKVRFPNKKNEEILLRFIPRGEFLIL